MVQKPPPHLALPRSVDLHSFNWASVGEAGARISVPRAPAVSLTIPAGAVLTPAPQDLYVSLLSEERYQPKLPDRAQAAVTPVVQCGPAHLTHSLQKPVVLSVPHVVGGNGGAEGMMVLYCADLDHKSAEWEVIGGGGGGDDGDGSVYMQTDPSSVHLVTERLGAYVMVAAVSDLNPIGNPAAFTARAIASL